MAALQPGQVSINDTLNNIKDEQIRKAVGHVLRAMYADILALQAASNAATPVGPTLKTQP